MIDLQDNDRMLAVRFTFASHKGRPLQQRGNCDTLIF